jgi:hypothetical protein
MTGLYRTNQITDLFRIPQVGSMPLNPGHLGRIAPQCDGVNFVFPRDQFLQTVAGDEAGRASDDYPLHGMKSENPASFAEII